MLTERMAGSGDKNVLRLSQPEEFVLLSRNDRPRATLSVDVLCPRDASPIEEHISLIINHRAKNALMIRIFIGVSEFVAVPNE